jgi:nucleotide-binding universal stress UspA family protein
MEPAQAPRPADSPVAPDPVFGRVVVGVDDTPESVVAAAQARALIPADGHLAVVAVAETYFAAHAGAAARFAEGGLEAETAEVLEQASELAAPDERRFTGGRLVDVLRAECGRTGATLVAVGARPHRRLSAAVFGGHEVELLHGSACALLVARPGWGPSKPSRVVVGVDGSEASYVAESVARRLAARLGCAIVPVVPLAARPGVEVLRHEREDAVIAPGELVDAVAREADERTLVVVGRGHDAERIVYATRCSVLVVPTEADDASRAG